jgi:hypothetical protein
MRNLSGLKQVYGGVEVHLHAALTLALGGVSSTFTHQPLFPLGKSPLHPFVRLGWLDGWSRRYKEKTIS